MSNKTNIINNFILLGATMIGVLIVGIKSSDAQVLIGVSSMTKIVLGMILWVFINTFAHEIAHMVSGRINGFKTVSFKIMFFRAGKVNGKFRISLCPWGEQFGEAELIPTKLENIEKRYKRVARAGIILNAILFIVSLFFFKYWQKWYWVDNKEFLYHLTAFSMPISLYFILANALPMSNEFTRNDGAVLWGIRKGDASVKVMLSLLRVHAMLYNGKTPSEIPSEYYFDVPQLPEDDPNFIILLNNRLYYYLDCGDFDNAKAVIERLESLSDYITKAMENQINADILYAYSTYMLSAEKADNLMEDYDKYLNKVSTPLNMRAKLAYVKNVLADEEIFNEMYPLCENLAKTIDIAGLKKFELKLLETLK